MEDANEYYKTIIIFRLIVDMGEVVSDEAAVDS